jgi:hypothetical protein
LIVDAWISRRVRCENTRCEHRGRESLLRQDVQVADGHFLLVPWLPMCTCHCEPNVLETHYGWEEVPDREPQPQPR